MLKKSVILLILPMIVFVGCLGGLVEVEFEGLEQLKALKNPIPQDKDKLINELQNNRANHNWPRFDSVLKEVNTLGLEKAMPILIQALQDENRRYNAAGTLGYIGGRAIDAVPALIQALQDADGWDFRFRVAWALGYIGAVDAVPTLIQASQDQDAEVRKGVAEALANIEKALVQKGKDAVPALIQALQDENTQVRQYAIGILEEIEDVVPVLIQALQDENAQVRNNVSEALRQIGTTEALQAVQERRLIDELQDEVGDVRANAAEALGEIKAVNTIPALIQVLQDQDAKVRASAAGSLGSIGSEDAVTALIQALQDQDAQVRANAAGSLGSIGSKDAAPTLKQALQDQDAQVRANAAFSLGQIGSKDTVPALKQALQDQDAQVRANAAGSLGSIGSEDAVPALIQALQDQDAQVRNNVSEALEQIDTPEALQALQERKVAELIKELQDGVGDVRANAAFSLGQIGSKDTVPALKQALQDQDAEVRISAVKALGPLGLEDTVPALIQVLQDQDAAVRTSAVQALGQIGTPEALQAVQKQKVAELIKKSQNSDPEIRISAVKELKEIGTPEAVQAVQAVQERKVAELIKELKDQAEDLEVRISAVKELEKIGTLGALQAIQEHARKIDKNSPKKITWKKDGAQMVLIPGIPTKVEPTYDKFGDLVSGVVGGSIEKTSPIYMDVHEVTIDQFKTFLKSTGYTRKIPVEDSDLEKEVPFDFKMIYEYSPTGKHPMISITYNDAAAYAKWVGKRLPTPAEWQHAARGGLDDPMSYAEWVEKGSSSMDHALFVFEQIKEIQNGIEFGTISAPLASILLEKTSSLGKTYPWEDSETNDYSSVTKKIVALEFERGKDILLGDGNYPISVAREYANYKGTGGKDKWNQSTAPVGSFKPNGYGLYDMAGNVIEYCQGWYDEDQENRVLKGGHWDSGKDDIDIVSTSTGTGIISDSRRGFRCVKDGWIINQ